eukprot:TRINITY_DN25869_c0_g1_i1.p1 TRINITY_DN25869_c0_g1~~TRINITY_DN25869_c0_g1_i1.p1  ORF type:complete len:832 (+),score=129.19 TRINITY_DN25869_c0_g1_i1:48-2498(+)
MGAVDAYVGLLKTRSRAVIALVIVVWLVLAMFAMKLSSTTTDSFSAAPGTRSYDETNAIQAVFPSVFDDRESAIILCEAPGDCHCQDASHCEGFRAKVDLLLKDLSQYASDGTLYSGTSFFDFTGSLLPLGKAYYNASASAMLVSFQFDKGQGIAGGAALSEAVGAAVKSAASLSGEGWTLRFSGQTAARLGATKEIGPIIGASDGTGIIFIVLLFGWQVRSWRLCWIPVINTIICLLMAQGLIYPLSSSGLILLPSYVPNVCLFLSIALSVDYSFFHLSRFQEVKRQGGDLEMAVKEMVTTAGRVVLVSGVVLLFCWLALAAFPVFGTNTLGYCSAITIFSCITVNLIMNPAMIMAFPKFFDNTKQDAWHCCRRWARESTPSLLNGEEEQAKNCYGALGRAATTMPGMVLLPLFVYALLLPGVVRLFTANFVVGGVSGGSASTDFAKNLIAQDFSNSQGNVPLTLMLSAPTGVSVKSDEYFAAGGDLARILMQTTGFKASSFRGVMIKQDPSSPDLSFYKYPDVSSQLEGGTIYNWAWGNWVNTENTSSLIVALPPYDAFGAEAKMLITQAREAVQRFNSLPGRADYVVAAFHPMAVEVDAENLTVGRFPLVVVITVAVVFSLIGLRYKAFIIPFKLLFTIAIPIMSTLGMGVFVFQDGVLNWTGIPSLQSDGGLVWINPVACTFMLIGFGLDYDIFLFSRIYATRKSGEFLDDKSAIVSAVGVTGPVISTAGGIMALAFVGMVVQHSNEFLCQMGFTMIFGVLMDTFVVRTLLVPAFLAMAGRYNWWPGEMPCETPSDVSQPRSAKRSVASASS